MSAPEPPTAPAPERPFGATAAKVLLVEVLVLAALWMLQARFSP